MAIQAFGVVLTLRPGLDVTGNEQGLVGNAGDTASRLNRLEVTAEEALATASFSELQLLCALKGRGLDVRLNGIAFQLGLVLFDVIGKEGIHAVG